MIGKPGAAGDDAGLGAGFDVDGYCVQGIDRTEVETRGGRGAHAFPPAAQRFEHGEARGAETQGGEKLRQRSRFVAIGR